MLWWIIRLRWIIRLTPAAEGAVYDILLVT